MIELDGLIHNKTKEYDQFRDNEMIEKGIHVLRIRNEDLNNIEEVLQKIESYLALLP